MEVRQQGLHSSSGCLDIGCLEAKTSLQWKDWLELTETSEINIEREKLWEMQQTETVVKLTNRPDLILELLETDSTLIKNFNNNSIVGLI